LEIPLVESRGLEKRKQFDSQNPALTSILSIFLIALRIDMKGLIICAVQKHSNKVDFLRHLSQLIHRWKKLRAIGT
jgi:hypothetical protein